MEIVSEPWSSGRWWVHCFPGACSVPGWKSQNLGRQVVGGYFIETRLLQDEHCLRTLVVRSLVGTVFLRGPKPPRRNRSQNLGRQVVGGYLYKNPWQQRRLSLSQNLGRQVVGGYFL